MMSNRKYRIVLWFGVSLLPSMMISSFVTAQQKFTLTPTQRQALSNVAQPRTLTRSQLIELRTTQPSGMELSLVGQDIVTSITQGNSPLTLAPGQYVRSDGSPKTEVIGGRKRYTLPVRFTGFDRSGAAIVHLAPVLEVENKAMRLGSDGETYQASVLIGLDDQNSPGTQRDLDPVTLQLSAERAQLDSRDVTVAHAGAPYERVEVTSHAPGDSVEITLRFLAQRVSASIDVERPSIVVSNVPETLDGLGVGYQTINVSLSEDAGPALRTVDVSFEPGHANPSNVKVSAQQHATVQIRTKSLKESAVLTLSGTGLITETRNIALTFPLALLIATVVGALLGAFGSRFIGASSEAKSRNRQFLGGTIAGIAGAAIYLLGVNVTGVPIPVMNNELAVGVAALLIALGGAKGLARLSGKKEQARDDKT